MNKRTILAVALLAVQSSLALPATGCGGISHSDPYKSMVLPGIGSTALMPVAHMVTITAPTTRSAPVAAAPSIPASTPVANLPVIPSQLNAVNTATLQQSLNAVHGNGIPTDRISWNFASPAQTIGTLNTLKKLGVSPTKIVAWDEDSCSLRHDGTSVFEVTPGGDIVFCSGSAVITAHKPMKIMFGGRSVSLDAGSIAQISVVDDVLIVRALHDEHRNDISISMGAETFFVAPGAEFCIGKDEKSIRSAMSDGLLRRQPVFTRLESGEHYATANVFLPQLLTQNNLLTQMYHGSAGDRAAVQKMMKLAIALHLTSGHRGSYKALN